MNGLYSIVYTGEAEDGAHVFTATLDPGHPVFHGHFPGFPVFPGVCSLIIVRECASRVTGTALKYSAVRESKFLSAIAPEAELTIRLRLTKGYNADAVILEGDTVMLKLKATLEDNG